MDFEPVPLPGQAAEPGTNDADAPPARSGQFKKREKPTEDAGKEIPRCITLAGSRRRF
jgi:hypothetical protein